MKKMSLRRVAQFSAVGALLLTTAVLVGKNYDSQSLSQIFDQESYVFYKECEVQNLDDLLFDFEMNQLAFMPLTPPWTEFTRWTQTAEITPLPFNPAGFPKDFVAGLLPAYSGGIVVYPVTVFEDQLTRERVFLNAKDEVLTAVKPAPDYDPRWFLLDMCPDLYTGRRNTEQIEWLTQLYDPAMLAIHYNLILDDDLIDHALKQSIEARVRKDKKEEEGGGGMRMMWTGGSVTNIRFTAIEKLTNGMRLTVAYPDDYTNRLDIFSTTNPLGEIVWWNLATTTNTNLSTNWIEWTDASFTNVPIRFYAAGNTDYDEDGDGVPNAREKYMFHTDPTDSNSFPVDVIGTVSYQGQYSNGLIWIVAVTSSDSWDKARSTTLAPPGAYTNAGIPNQADYWFKAFRDADTNGILSPWEPWSWYSATGTYLTTNLSGIDISLADPPPNVNGTISYGGTGNGSFYVIAATSSNDWSTNHSAVLSSPGLYNIPNLTQTNYWIKAFLDGDADGLASVSDPCGVYTNNPIIVTNGVFYINLTLTDQDIDTDQCPDWWEVQYFGSITNWSGADDPDADGLVNSNEYAAGTDPTIWDTDGDGVRDGDDPYPLDPNLPPNASGTISYGGMQTGRIWVVAVTASNSWATNHCAVLDSPGTYLIPNLLQTNYWIKAFRDTDGNGMTNATEARGVYEGNPITVTNQVTSIDIALIEDFDSDDLPDWWEMQWFGNLNQTASGNVDGDNWTNYAEYVYGLNPTKAETDTGDEDGDGYPNIYETTHGTRCDLAGDYPAPTYYVALSGLQQAPYTNWTMAATNIQTALNYSSNAYDIIMVADGTYTGAGNRNLDFGGRKLLLVSENGASRTVIDCQTNGRAFYFHSGESNCTVLSGFQIINGLSTTNGGGIYCYNSSPTIQYCQIISNQAVQSDGGGIYARESAPIIRHCLIAKNRADDDAGGVRCKRANALIEDCLLDGNAAWSSGGGMYVDDKSTTVVARTVFHMNSVWGDVGGGGVRASESSTILTIRDSVFAGNMASTNGGGLYAQNSANVGVIGCTFVDNLSSASNCATAIALGGGFIAATNTLFSRNGNKPLDTGVTNLVACYTNATAAVVPGGWRLLPNSPCINAGTNVAGLADADDIDGELRIGNDRVDIGADEWHDSDGDGMADAWEMAYFGNLSPSGLGDADGDGATDAAEYLAGSNPTSSTGSYVLSVSGLIANWVSVNGVSANGVFANWISGNPYLWLGTVPLAIYIGDTTVGSSMSESYRIRLDNGTDWVEALNAIGSFGYDLHSFQIGTAYTITVTHVASSYVPSPDYDYKATVHWLPASTNGSHAEWVAGSSYGVGFVLHDPARILGNWYTDGQTTNFVAQGTNAVLCILPEVVIEPASNIVTEGDDSTDFTAVITPSGLSGLAYSWTWLAVANGGNNPSVTFSATNSLATHVNVAHWYAVPDDRCTSNDVSDYQLRCTVDVGGASCSTSATMSVQLVDPAAQTIPIFGIVGSPVFNYSSSSNLWYLSGTGTLARTVSFTTNWYLRPNSEFTAKVRIHEDHHTQDCMNGFDGHEFVTVGELFARISPLTDTTSTGLVAKIFAERDQYYIDEQEEYASLEAGFEVRAYNVSDTVAPDYYYSNCGRFTYP